MEKDEEHSDVAIRITVVGDVIEDRHFYHADGGVTEIRELGGAAVLTRLLAAALAARQAAITVELGIATPDLGAYPPSHRAHAVWAPFKADPDKKDVKVWRAKLPMGRGRASAAATNFAAEFTTIAGPAPDVLVLDDGGFDFRNRRRDALWRLPGDGAPGPRWIVLKMSGPIAQGDLWHEVIDKHADRLITIVAANDLRDELALLRLGASWEGAIEDLAMALRDDPTLVPLNKSRHLVIVFSADGAVWINRDRPEIATLVFDPKHAEREWSESYEGQVFGYLTAFTAAVALAAAVADELALAPALAEGLAAMRELLRGGHGEVSAKAPPSGYPVEALAKALNGGAGAFSIAPVPLPRPKETLGKWTMAAETPGAGATRKESVILGLARQVVINGFEALRGTPHARFGDLVTADRVEIEALRGLRRLMLDYKAREKVNKPVSLGIFGPPGAGKSFGVKQLAKQVFGETAWLEFNLSQFEGPDELVGALHRVRDLVLGGETPVVFWDEFDSRDLMWLQYLLAPMQDGKFQSRHQTHSVGKCVFVFAGGTAYTHESFGPKETETVAWANFKLKKGPDFKSRLDGYLNVLGPNQRTREGKPDERDADDVSAPLRRALLIRSWLSAKSDARLEIDSDLLDALLLAEKYEHGARSLEKLVEPLKEARGRPVRRSLLPPHSRLAMHVGATRFYEILGRNTQYRISKMIDQIAKWIHERWLEGDWPKQDHLNRPYDELAEIDKEDNRAAARRIPDGLALVGLGLVRRGEAEAGKGLDESALKAYLEAHIERLAEAEHDGWMRHRAKNGWTFGKPRDDAKKLHPSMIAYKDLPASEKEKDRIAIRNYPNQVKGAGYEIVWL